MESLRRVFALFTNKMLPQIITNTVITVGYHRQPRRLNSERILSEQTLKRQLSLYP